MAPEGQPAVPPAPHLTGTAVAGVSRVSRPCAGTLRGAMQDCTGFSKVGVISRRAVPAGCPPRQTGMQRGRTAWTTIG